MYININNCIYTWIIILVPIFIGINTQNENNKDVKSPEDKSQRECEQSCISCHPNVLNLLASAHQQ